MSNLDDLLGELNAARDVLYTLLRAQRPETLTSRPASGDWSVIENVRHLLYAEQYHLRRLLPGGSKRSAIGLPPGGKPQRSGAGTASTDDLEEVLAAWDAVHETLNLNAVEHEVAARALERNLRHLRAHTRTIKRLIEG